MTGRLKGYHDAKDTAQGRVSLIINGRDVLSKYVLSLEDGAKNFVVAKEALCIDFIDLGGEPDSVTELLD